LFGEKYHRLRPRESARGLLSQPFRCFSLSARIVGAVGKANPALTAGHEASRVVISPFFPDPSYKAEILPVFTSRGLEGQQRLERRPDEK
jgi:hypothetical protein